MIHFALPDEDFSAFLEYKEMADKIDFMKDDISSHTSSISTSTISI